MRLRTNRPIGSIWQHKNGIRWKVISPTKFEYAGKDSRFTSTILDVDKAFNLDSNWHRIDFIAYYNEI